MREKEVELPSSGKITGGDRRSEGGEYGKMGWLRREGDR